MAHHKQARIVGSGVSGLSTGIVLQEAGWDVSIWTAAPAHHTTSIIAAAIWHPFKAYPQADVLRWGKATYDVFAGLAGEPESGIIVRDGFEIWPFKVPDPWWKSAVARFGRCDHAQLPPGYEDGYAFRAPVIDMPIYLDYLINRFAECGGVIESRRLQSLDEAAAPDTLVVNCTGLAARDLAGDETLKPIRGQVIWVSNPGIEHFWLDESDPGVATYIIPRIHDCVLGGTVEEGEWDTTPDPAIADDILRRCLRIEPRLNDARIKGHRSGLRPARPVIRLERDTLADGTPCIHNYGHGGAGVTLSWGCAQEVARLADETR